MAMFYFKESEILETNQWLEEKKKSLSEGSVRIPICSFFSLVNGLNCNWIPAASKRDFLRELRNSFDEQYWYCKEDSSKVEKLVAIDNSYQERLEERLRLPVNSLIYQLCP